MIRRRRFAAWVTSAKTRDHFSTRLLSRMRSGSDCPSGESCGSGAGGVSSCYTAGSTVGLQKALESPDHVRLEQGLAVGIPAPRGASARNVSLRRSSESVSEPVMCIANRNAPSQMSFLRSSPTISLISRRVGGQSGIPPHARAPQPRSRRNRLHLALSLEVLSSSSPFDRSAAQLETRTLTPGSHHFDGGEGSASVAITSL